MKRAGLWTSRLAALPAIALMLAATAFVLREGVAELTAIDANQRIAVWERGGSVSGPQLEGVEATIKRAIALSPRNGAHRETLGTVYFARAVAPRRTLEGRLYDFDRAVVEYRAATRLSTVSGYAWGNLLTAKHYAGQIDEEFTTALRNAARFAPHEAAVQTMVIGAVLPRWTQLDSEARAIAARTVNNGWDEHRPMLLAEAREAAGREIWCSPGLLAQQPDLATAMRRLCAALAKPVSEPEPAARRSP